jgi:hypothetical protein
LSWVAEGRSLQREYTVSSKAPTEKALRLRLQAARVVERGLPDQVQRAYGHLPDQLATRPIDDPSVVEARDKARSALVERGLLTQEELDTLPMDEATAVALGHVRDQIVALQEEQAAAPTKLDAFGRAPRTLRR